MELTFDDFGFTGEEMTMLEYRANYVEEPECFACGADLMKFMGACDIPFELTEIEADKLLGYMEKHDFLLGEKEGKVFRGDLSYQSEKSGGRRIPLMMSSMKLRNGIMKC